MIFFKVLFILFKGFSVICSLLDELDRLYVEISGPVFCSLNIYLNVKECS